jgi:hypothetical protein
MVTPLCHKLLLGLPASAGKYTMPQKNYQMEVRILNPAASNPTRETSEDSKNFKGF